ncbi:Ff.00g064180.m01.CDS01 [Fusarium sp. VM40]|nr:Ff.00g064180.m01.CDS01 [Fusarium sp. VM40]
MASTSIQLQSAQAPLDEVRSPEELASGHDTLNPNQASSLPPVDYGKDAYLFLGAAFLIDCFVWGFPFSFGIFQDYYLTHEPFEGSGQIATIGTTSMGIMYFGNPFVMALWRFFPKQCRYAPFAGALAMCGSLATSSFSHQVTHLVVTQGVVYAIGGLLCFCPCVLYVEEWFVERRGLALGTMWAGTGVGGCTIPLLLEFLLGKYGFRTTLRLWSGLLFAVTIPLLYFVKPRVKPSQVHGQSVRRINLGFVLNGKFLLYQLPSMIQALGFFIPSIWLPSYARTVFHASSKVAALTIVTINLASAAGNIVMGFLIDRFHVTTCILVSSFGTVIGTFLLWGLAQNLAVLFVFCIMYGLFAGSFSATWAGIMSEMTSRPTPSDHAGSPHRGIAFDPIMVFGVLEAGRGIGNLVSGPLSEVLVQNSLWKDQALAGYGSGYGTLIVFTGITGFLGGGGFFCRRLGWL